MVWIYWLLSYFIGNILTAWWIGKWKKTDLRQARSGNLGARNAGAVLGKTAFILTFLGDSLKGVLVLYIGTLLGFSQLVIAIAGLLVIIGHMFPIWLKGRGGKGIATFIGVAIYTSPPLFGILAIIFIILISLLRSATLSMIFAFSAYGIISWFIPAYHHAVPLSIGIVIILIKHWRDILESWDERWWKRTT